MDLMIWAGIAFCLSQSAMFSGLNLAFFSVTRLRLEIEASGGNQAASRVLRMRADSNFLLTTILWGNVGINVLLTLLSNSVMAGLIAFAFSTFLITFFGEIIPQAYFSRNALRMASMLAPALRFYQVLLYPLAKPSALMLDAWLGRESIHYFREHNLKKLIQKHVEESKDIDRVEGYGAINFLSFDDLTLADEGVAVDPASVIQLEFRGGQPLFPAIHRSSDDPFLKQLNRSGKKWVLVAGTSGVPECAIDADGFLRGALFDGEAFDPGAYAHRVTVIHDQKLTLGEVLELLEFDPVSQTAGQISRDVVLLWGEQKRILTGTDILARLLHGIARTS